MGKLNKKTRKFAQKAFDILKNISTEYPNGINDVSTVGVFERTWIERSVQIVRENIRHIWFYGGKPKWFESLRISRNKTSHQLDYSDNRTFENLCSNLFSNIGEMLNDLQDIIPKIKTESKKKRNFENFAPSSAFGSKEERKQLVDAMEDMVAPVEPTDIKIEYP